MALRKTHVSVEMNDGTTFEDVRVLAADKIRAEAVCREKGWDMNSPLRTAVVFAWAALKRRGETDTNDVAEFLDQIADYEISREDEADEDESDPT